MIHFFVMAGHRRWNDGVALVDARHKAGDDGLAKS
ncbi:MAG: hypothetical protein QOJ15_5384 [Bradyrhizobium sp.]|jgi:hypothetical protein|nr:hypothetical protein [Bradyrhizobium sp.]